MSAAPPIDPRNAAALRATLLQKLHDNAPEWSPTSLKTGDTDQVGAALVGIFARFGEIVIQRLNRAPEKNFLSFLDLLGVSREPPRPARVPLTFTLAAGSPTDAVVPAGTQVAAPPAEGERAPVIFETERELTVVAASLRALFTADAARDMVADRSSLLQPAANGQRVFSGDRANSHVLYIAHREYFAYPQMQTLSVDVAVHGSVSSDPTTLQWEAWNGASWAPLTPTDGTHGLQNSGTLTFLAPAAIPELTIDGVTSRWLRCRLLTPVTAATTPVVAMTRASLLPTLDSIKVRAQLQRSGFMSDNVFSNAARVDFTRPFQPLGAKPVTGDALFLRSDEAFSKAGGTVTLDVAVAVPGVAASGLKLRWQTWSGSDWVMLGESTATNGGIAPFSDGTLAFTKSGLVTFLLPAVVTPTAINGVTGYWLRVVIVAGNYGVDAHYDADTSPAGFKFVASTLAPPLLGSLAIGYQLTTPTVPAQNVLACNAFAFEDLGVALANGIAVTPFRALEALPPAMYAAFSVPPTRTSFPNRTVSVYQAPQPLQYGEKATPLHPDASILSGAAGSSVMHTFTLTNPRDTATLYTLSALGGAWPRTVNPLQATVQPGQSIAVTVTVNVPNAGVLGATPASDRCFLRVNVSPEEEVYSVSIETRVGAVPANQRSIRWEYWNGTRWSALVAIDGSERLTHPGVLEFLGPTDFTVAKLFGAEGYWVRALFAAGDDVLEPRLRAFVPNTTFASQTLTLRDEVLGSSDSSASQQFNTTRSPALEGQVLQVREPGPLSDDDIASLEEEGVGAVTPAGGGLGNDVWVRWQEVPDFYGSGPLDRHYVLDHIAGQVSFGDGVHGRIPPRGASNIRMSVYRTGGGDTGNRAAGSIVQLKTTVPYVEKVFNIEAAAGGFAAETTDSLVERAPRTLRHGGRAVTAEDYEDLARLASPEIARAKCVPLRRLQDDPLGATPAPGSVSVIVVPGGAAVKPLPTLELLTQTEEFLRTCQAANADVAVVGPLYVRVDVSVEVALVALEGASQVEQTIRAQLAAFLHPLTGGRDGTGWAFGREPQRSDLIAVVSAVAGVDHLRQLSLTEVEDASGVRATGRFLVYSGNHQVKLTFLNE